jgi:hypothetical protein
MTSAAVNRGRGIGLGVYIARISVNRLSRLMAAAEIAGPEDFVICNRGLS